MTIEQSNNQTIGQSKDRRIKPSPSPTGEAARVYKQIVAERERMRKRWREEDERRAAAIAALPRDTAPRTSRIAHDTWTGERMRIETRGRTSPVANYRNTLARFIRETFDEETKALIGFGANLHRHIKEGGTK